MNADRLYYANPYQTEATATVISCEEVKGGWCVELDQTLFYPTGGGQPCDTGTLNGIEVTDVYEKDNRVFHICAAPLNLGETVTGKIDWAHRFMLMQQHSGEHIVSGIVHSRFGYDNVGFHMGSDVITIDFSGEISYEQMQQIESAANAVVYRNLPCKVVYLEEGSTAEYRSKKALSGQVRLVQFADVDSCACCGLHVRNSGEVGIIKLLSAVKFRNGTRIQMLCGERALEHLNAIFEQNRTISALLSAKPLATASAAQRVSEELKNTQYRCTCLENELFARLASEYAGMGDVLVFEKDLSPDAVRRLCDAVVHTCGGRCAVFSEKEGGYNYAIGTLDGDLREFTRTMNAELNGRGGGKPNFVQGSVSVQREAIEAFFQR